MMRTRTIATGAGITGSADCPPAFRRSGNPVPLGLWCCAVSSPAAAPPFGSITHTCKSLTHSHVHSSLAHPCTGLVRPPHALGALARPAPALTHPPACACSSPRLSSLRVDLAPLHPRVATAVAGAITADGWPRRRPQSPPRGCGTSAVRTACDLEEEPRCARYGSTPEGGCSRHVRPHSSSCQASFTPLCSAAAARFAARRLSRSACFAAFLFPNACSERVASRAAVPETPLPGAPATARAAICLATFPRLRSSRASVVSLSHAASSAPSTWATPSARARASPKPVRAAAVSDSSASSLASPCRLAARTGVPRSAATTRRASGVHSLSLLPPSLEPPPRRRCAHT